MKIEELGDPSNDRVLVESLKPPKQTASGLHLPETLQAKQERRSGRGFIRGAGLAAQDVMKSEGWRLGDEIIFGTYTPVYIAGAEWENAEKRECEALVLNVGDVLLNVSRAKRRANGVQAISYEKVSDGRMQHLIKDVSLTTDTTLPKPKNGEIHAD